MNERRLLKLAETLPDDRNCVMWLRAHLHLASK